MFRSVFNLDDRLTPLERLGLLLQAAHRECQAEDEFHRQATRSRVSYLERSGWFKAWADWAETERAHYEGEYLQEKV